MTAIYFNHLAMLTRGCSVMFYLDQQWVSKTQRTLQVLPEGIIQEAGSGDFTVFVLIHYELCGLA